jgi:hypothetical protein
MMEDAGPHCMEGVDLVHLEFLPAGNTPLTRRAKQASRLSAAVVRWGRSRKRYERQGILAETDAIEQAEAACLADEQVRERRRTRDAEYGAATDERFAANLAAAIRTQFPGCPTERAARIAAAPQACAAAGGLAAPAPAAHSTPRQFGSPSSPRCDAMTPATTSC